MRWQVWIHLQEGNIPAQRGGQVIVIYQTRTVTSEWKRTLITFSPKRLGQKKGDRVNFSLIYRDVRGPKGDFGKFSFLFQFETTLFQIGIFEFVKIEWKLSKQLTTSGCIRTAVIISVQMVIESLLVMQHNHVQIETVSILTRSVIEEMIVIMQKMNLIVFSWPIFRKGIDGLFVRHYVLDVNERVLRSLFRPLPYLMYHLSRQHFQIHLPLPQLVDH